MTLARVATLLGAAALGAVVAMAGLLAHRDAARLGAVPLPWGLVLALLAAFAVVVAAGSLAGASAAALAAGGWVVCVLLALRGRPEGDFLMAADALGQIFTWGGMVTVAAAFVVALRSVAVRSPGEQ